MVGSYPQDLRKPKIDDTYVAKSLNDALEKAKANNPTMYLAYHDVQAAQYQYEQTKGTMLPTFTVEGSQKYGDELDASDGDTDELKVMLKMNYNLYSGGSDAAKSRSAASQISKAKISVTMPTVY